MVKKSKKKKPLTWEDLLKLEIASELGLMDKVNDMGWSGLTAAETGRIGGMLRSRKRNIENVNVQGPSADL